MLSVELQLGVQSGCPDVTLLRCQFTCSSNNTKSHWPPVSIRVYSTRSHWFNSLVQFGCFWQKWNIWMSGLALMDTGTVLAYASDRKILDNSNHGETNWMLNKTNSSVTVVERLWRPQLILFQLALNTGQFQGFTILKNWPSVSD